MRRISTILFFITLFGSILRSQENQHQKLLDNISIYGFAEVTVLRADVPDEMVLTRNVSIVSANKTEYLISLSFRSVDWFIGAGYPYRITEIKGLPQVDPAVRLKGLTEWNVYPTLSQYDSIMRSFATNYPAICRLDTIGTSVLGKSVLVLKISDNVNADEDEPEVFYTSSMHGDEIAGIVLFLRLADYMLKNYATDTRIANIVNNTQLWINPMSNPDGTYRSGNTISIPTRYNASGVDLNRNFPDPGQPGEVQAKENVEMIAFMKSRRFILSVNVHSGFEVLNYPWDRWVVPRIHADDDWFRRTSRTYADTVHLYSPSTYLDEYDNGVVRGSDWYQILGGRMDYVTYELQGRELTIEIDNTKLTPPDSLPRLWQYNYRSFLRYIENALSGVKGIVTDFDTGDPLKAKVFVNYHDKDSSHVYSYNDTGRYYRMIAPGTWSFTFSAAGYADSTVSVTMPDIKSSVEVNIALKPLVTVIPDTLERNIILYPVPVDGDLNIFIPGIPRENVPVIIFDMSGRLVMSTKVVTGGGLPGTVNLSNLRQGYYILRISLPSTGRVFQRAIVVTGN